MCDIIIDTFNATNSFKFFNRFPAEKMANLKHCAYANVRYDRLVGTRNLYTELIAQ